MTTPTTTPTTTTGRPAGTRRPRAALGAVRRLGVAAALGAALLAGGAGTALAAPPTAPAPAGPVPAALPYGPYTCKSGFVWREIGPSDPVCVSVASRTTARAETAAGPANRAGSGPYGPDTCKPGFVWREAQPSDHVCVSFSGAARDRVRSENGNGVLNLADPAGVPYGRVSITNSRDQLSCYMYGNGRATPGAEQWFWSVGVPGYGTIRAGVARADGAGVVPSTKLRDVYRNGNGPLGIPVVVADTATGVVTRAGTTNSYGNC
ncbi:hypothetical protein DMP17_14620 [Pseudonocardia sp. TMWB2A]|uniref:hypothetical protein n=1 Tax=Pseudonocardia sp. TMWB2A TaxID=687430 RepID=UPI00307EC6BD